MKSVFAIMALVSNMSASQVQQQDVEWIMRPYGPYSVPVETHERAFQRPPDSRFEHDGYGDSAGVSTGTLSQIRNGDVEWITRPYGPYSVPVETHERAFQRPPDSRFEHDGYGDSAGVSTGTLSQMRNRDVEWNYRPFGPYSKDVAPHNERALDRPDDSMFKLKNYGDSAGQSTGTIAQRFRFLSQGEPKETPHTDRVYGPYFDEGGPKDGSTKKLDIDGGDGRDKNIPYGPYDGEKPQVGKNGSPILPGQPRPEDRVIPFPQYGDVGGQNGFMQVFVPSQGIFLVQTPYSNAQETTAARKLASDVVLKQLYDMDAWQEQHAKAMQQWADDAKYTFDVNHQEIKNTYEFD